MNDLTDLFGPVIHAYTRADALRDGELVEVDTKLASEAGFRYPIAMTRTAWESCVEWTDADAERTGALQDETGRLWDVLWMTRCAIVRTNGQTDRVRVRLVRIKRTNPRRHGEPMPEPVDLIATIGPGDQGEPVMTLMMPGED